MKRKYKILILASSIVVVLLVIGVLLVPRSIRNFFYPVAPQMPPEVILVFAVAAAIAEDGGPLPGFIFPLISFSFVVAGCATSFRICVGSFLCAMQRYLAWSHPLAFLLSQSS